jgi:hypothetical protein
LCIELAQGGIVPRTRGRRGPRRERCARVCERRRVELHPLRPRSRRHHDPCVHLLLHRGSGWRGRPWPSRPPDGGLVRDAARHRVREPGPEPGDPVGDGGSLQQLDGPNGRVPERRPSQRSDTLLLSPRNGHSRLRGPPWVSVPGGVRQLVLERRRRRHLQRVCPGGGCEPDELRTPRRMRLHAVLVDRVVDAHADVGCAHRRGCRARESVLQCTRDLRRDSGQWLRRALQRGRRTSCRGQPLAGVLTLRLSRLPAGRAERRTSVLRPTLLLLPSRRRPPLVTVARRSASKWSLPRGAPAEQASSGSPCKCRPGQG